jgi:hypothetical protein
MYYTYLYFRQDVTPYYVGKGSGRRAYKNGGRPCRRPKSSHRIFVQYWESESKAFEMERWYILFYGRQDLGTGILRNMSDGGEGTSNLSAEVRAKMSVSHTGKKWSEEVKAKMRKSAIGKNLGNTFRLGKKHLPETIQKFREQRRGKKLPPRSEAFKAMMSLRMMGNTYGKKRQVKES